MGSPKALLPDADGCPFVVRVVRTLREAGLERITVVTSAPSHQAIDAALAEDRHTAGTRTAINPEPDRGQLSSIWVGMDAAILDDAEGLLMTLVDAPFVSAATVRAVIHAHQQTRAAIVRPANGDRHGHPVIFDRALFDELRHADPAVGAKSVVRGHPEATLNVPIDDEGAFLDIDTPDDYARSVAPGVHE
jgi:molybdenum cofactor cytidylyltransferase